MTISKDFMESKDNESSKSIVFRDTRPISHTPGDVTLFDMIFTEKYNTLPSETPIYIDVKNPDKPLRYGELKRQALVCAANLKRQFDLQRGDVIAVCSPDNLQYPVIFFASLIAGCVFAPMHHSAFSTAEEIKDDMNTLRPKLLILHHLKLESVLPLAKNTGIPESNVLIFDTLDQFVSPVRTVKEVLLQSSQEAQPYAYTREEITNTPCCLYFTSGSTGKRKAVMISQSALVCLLVYNATPLSPAIRHLAPNTLSYVSSLITCLMFPVYFGMSVYMLNTTRALTLEDVCEAVQEHEISLLSLPPYMSYGLVKDAEISQRYDLSSVKIVGVGGAAVDKTMVILARENKGLVFINFYGMTECPAMFSNSPDWTLAGSIGRPGAGSSVRLVGSDGKDLSVGEAGELRVKGPTMALGYYRNPEATAELFDDQGYMRTGDICTVSEDGLFYYVARFKDLIRYKSTDIRPGQIESLLLTHPSVSDCAVVGVYSEEEGTELPRAYVTLVHPENYRESLLHEIQLYANAQLPENKQLRAGVFKIDKFPRTGSGKIQRFELSQWVNKKI